MLRHLAVLFVAALVVALPFGLRQREPQGDWRPGDPRLVIVSPHNEAIRSEFARAFSDWHQARYGRPVKIEWLNIGGTTEIGRYLTSEFVAAMRAWWVSQGQAWPAGAGEAILARTADAVPEIHQAFRATDDPGQVSARIDLFFGGGEYDHQRAFEQGLTVAPWPPGQEPHALLDGVPREISGEIWRTDTMFGTVVSTFGICYNRDRLRELGVKSPPTRWVDLTDPVYFRQLGLADPSKSGSIAKAFEMIIHQQIQEAVDAAGGAETAVPDGWANGIRVVQLIGANARYFTDSASKVPIDVAAGDAAAGLAIDFYARFQAQVSGPGRMEYVTPVGGSSVSCDPISLLRGAPNRVVAVRFIEFVLGDEGQRLWCDRPGRPGGPKKYALRRLPIRREFYSPGNPHLADSTDDLRDPRINPYALAEKFTYHPQWTARHFNVHRDLIRVMCLDAGDELRAAWQAIIAHGGPARQPAAMHILQRLPDRPEPLTWANAREITRQYDRLTYLREWTACFRENYRAAREIVERASRPFSEQARTGGTPVPLSP